MVTPEFNKLVGQNIRNARVRLGLGQVRLAAILGMDWSRLQDIERGYRTISIITALRLCTVLGITFEDLVAGADEMR